jgi:hypothetical protein
VQHFIVRAFHATNATTGGETVRIVKFVRRDSPHQA